MGVGWHPLQELCAARSQGLNLENTVTIGRQNCHASNAEIVSAFKKYRLDVPSQALDLAQRHAYSEPLFLWLGAKQVESIDNSNYENATRVWDMNSPIPTDWHEQFDLVYDGGSLEHVFNVPQALENYTNLTRVGGTVMVHTEANNWMGHGFYQFSPELFYRVFSEANGLRVDRLVIFENYNFAPHYEVPDPMSVCGRIELSNAWIGVSMIVRATRIRKTKLFASWPQQSDYSQAWNLKGKQDGGDIETETKPVQSEPARQSMRESLKRNLPRLIAWKHAIMNRYPFLSRFTWKLRKIAYHKTHAFTAQPDRYRRSP